MKDKVVVIGRDQVSSEISGEVIILGTKSGLYYGLDSVGALIWKLIQTPQTVAQVRDAIVAEYEVEQDDCEHDLLELLRELAKAGLVEINDEPNL